MFDPRPNLHSRGRKKKWTDADVAKMKELPFRSRRNLRTLSKALQIPLSSMHNLIRDGRIKRTSTYLKPLLNNHQKSERIRHCIDNIMEDGYFRDMYDRVHVDEKWFFVMPQKETVYLLEDEEPPLRCAKSKRFIPKLMFLCAVARPRYDHRSRRMFDGKIGIWPVCEMVAAKRNSRNRPRGTMEMKPVNVNKEVYKKMFLENVIPAIKSKWPDGNRIIIIQHDNASPPGSVMNDNDIDEALKGDGFDISIQYQPPNSPDLNVLDLSYFNSIQSLAWISESPSLEKLVENVQYSFSNLSIDILKRAFLTLQSVMDQRSYYQKVEINTPFHTFRKMALLIEIGSINA